MTISLNKKNIISIIVIIAGVLVIIGFIWDLLFFKKNDVIIKNQEGVEVAATIFPIYDIARSIAVDKDNVRLILPPGASPHLFEFSPQQIKDLQKTKIIFAIGHNLDNWVFNLAENLNDARTIILDHNINLKTNDGEINPHYWLNFNNARVITDNIKNEFARFDSANAEKYEENARVYKELLFKAEMDLLEKSRAIANAKIITFHDAWDYFADNFGLEIVGVFESGAGAEPTPKDLVHLGGVIRGNNIKVIFSEPQLTSLALKSFAKDNNLEIKVLDPVGGFGNRASFIDLMGYNFETMF